MIICNTSLYGLGLANLQVSHSAEILQEESRCCSVVKVMNCRLVQPGRYDSCWDLNKSLVEVVVSGTTKTAPVLLLFACLFAWDLTALSAQIGYIAPQQ